VTKSEIRRSASAKEIINCFELLRPRNYEGPMCRIGGDSDGGYLIPDIDYYGVISPGTGNQVDFENHFVEKGIKVVCVDGSVQRPDNLLEDAVFLPKYLSASILDDFNITLAQIVKNHFPSTQSLLLQCDIEGAEWDIFTDCNPELLSSFTVVTLELHYLNRLLEKRFLDNVFKKFLAKFQENFVIINCHPNNAGEDFYIGFQRYPEILELTLINIRAYKGNHKFDNSFQKLNKPNVLFKPARNYNFLK
jgi:hypothetical protein